jgi:hypothetical protein
MTFSLEVKRSRRVVLRAVAVGMVALSLGSHVHSGWPTKLVTVVAEFPEGTELAWGGPALRAVAPTLCAVWPMSVL